jgi:hypothetical protein
MKKQGMSATKCWGIKQQSTIFNFTRDNTDNFQEVHKRKREHP